MKNNLATLIILLSTLSLLLSACVSTPVVNPTLTPPPTNSPVPLTPTLSPTATVVSLPALTLKQGDFYFSLNGKPVFIFSRNLAGFRPDDYAVLVEMAHKQGDLLVRVGTDNESMGGNYGYGYTNTGEVLEDWSHNWEQFFDIAEANNVYVMPYFTGWVNWNNTVPNTWANNPFNSKNGGPANDPSEIFKKDSPTQLLYLKWFKSVITRWQKHKNILAWEVISEVNYIDGISQPEGVYLVEQMAKVAREADPQHRPVTASLADVSEWPDFYRSDAIDFINFHPYPSSGQLDSYALQKVRQYLNTYNKPVIIGESGLNAANPDTTEGMITVAQNANVGIQHAIWAETVSGAMNGRALWWEDGYGIYFQSLGMPFLQKYINAEAPAYKFINGMDMTGFKPIAAQSTGKIFGAALGNEKLIIGWFRDVGSEPPNWNLQPTISKQSVTITIPGSVANWRVDFYDTKDGTTILSSSSVSAIGNTITIPLPDFHDDIAFKISAIGGTISTLAPGTVNTDAIAGTWSGTITNAAGTFSTPIKLSIQGGCESGKICGTFSAPQLPCSGDLFLQAINGETYLFMEQNASGATSCKSGGYEQLQLQADGTLSYGYLTSPQATATSTGTLKHP